MAEILAKLIGGPHDGMMHRVDFGSNGLPPNTVTIARGESIDSYRIRTGRLSLHAGSELALTYDFVGSEVAR